MLSCWQVKQNSIQKGRNNMARTSIYNRNYPGKKVEKGSMATHDGVRITSEYIGRLYTVNASAEDRANAMYTLNMCMSHFARVSPFTDISSIRDTINFWMGLNPFGNDKILSLVCSYMESILHAADRYNGFNNYAWSNGGSTRWHEDYPHKYDSDELHATAMAAMRDPKYTTQEYHRIYY